MRNFRTLFKYERRMLFPGSHGKRFDFFGALTSLIFTLAIAGIFGFLVYSIANDYLVLKVDRVSDPVARAYELINALYTIVIVALSVMCLEKMRSTLTRTSDTPIFLRLPVKHGTIFRAKFMALLLWTYVAAFLLIVPISVIFYFLLGASTDFLLRLLLVYLLLPMVSFLIATILILPYMILINFLRTRYFLSFLSLSVLAAFAFFVYSGILGVLQSLFENKSTNNLFTDEFKEVLITATGYTYPANSLASILLGIDMQKSLIITISIAVVALVLAFFVTGGLYRLVLYKNRDGRTARKKRSRGSRRRVTASLLRKEFITVYREPKYLFSYFTIAFTMPFMVHCCYTLFHELIRQKLDGLGAGFPLALIVVLVFTILTNTFCATNITRDGKAALKAKSFPIKASKLLFSKVLFCSIVSSLSVIGSVIAVGIAANLTLPDAITVGVMGVVFSFTQILIATRTDLNCAVVDASPEVVAKTSDRTIAKVISIGLFFAVIIGFVALFISVFTGAAPELLGGFVVNETHMYLISAVITLIYFVFGILFYRVNIEKAFSKLTK